MRSVSASTSATGRIIRMGRATGPVEPIGVGFRDIGADITASGFTVITGPADPASSINSIVSLETFLPGFGGEGG
jgi:hypothetical protein